MHYLDKTKVVIKNKSLESRKKLGQYFTPSEEVYGIINWLGIKKESLVLEPSFGTGQFFEQLLDLTDNLYGVEIDKEIFTPYNVNCFNEDFLTWKTDVRFDFIIGNPPYFETNKYNKDFEEIVSGRTNIYSLFIKKSIDLLKDGGTLAFIIPTTINTGAYFTGIRNYIIKNCSIVEMYEIDFPDVEQKTQVMILKKDYGLSNKFLVYKKNVIFSRRYKMLNYLVNNFNTVEDLGFVVKTGSIVWNQNKDLLDDTQGSILIWNENIKEELTLNKKENQRIRKVPDYPYGIVFKRIISKNNYCFVDIPFLAENHVNVIYHTDKQKLLELFELLKKSKIERYLKNFTESTQLSKLEVQEMPLWASMKETGQT